MSWLFSRALVAEFSPAIYLGGEPCAPSSAMLTPQAYSLPDKTTAFSRLSRFGMTCKPLKAGHGEELLMSFLAAFPVRTYLAKASERGSTGPSQGCGATWRGSLAKYDPATHSLRTAQNSFIQDLTECSVTLPSWGLMRSGEIYQRPQPALPISETESGLLPTPRVSRGFTNPTLGKKRNDCLTTAILGSPVLGMRPNPRYVEWMMGFPIGWTELRGSETPRFREWQQQHGESSPVLKEVEMTTNLERRERGQTPEQAAYRQGLEDAAAKADEYAAEDWGGAEGARRAAAAIRTLLEEA